MPMVAMTTNHTTHQHTNPLRAAPLSPMRTHIAMATLIVLETAPNAKKLAASIPRYSEMGHVVLRAAGGRGGGGEDDDVGVA